MNESILSVEHLTKRYGENTILEDVSFSVARGEVIVIVGPSGCGKSTLLRCLNALEPIQGGEIRLDGETVDSGAKDLTRLRQRIGMVFQSYELFPHMSVLNNILIAPVQVQKRDREEVKAEALELLERVGLSAKKDAYPRELSGGQKQRVAIARAIVGRPDLLLADEPTGALDTKAGNQIMEIFRTLSNEGMTIIMITHEPAIAACADKLCRILDGELRADGAAHVAVAGDHGLRAGNIVEFVRKSGPRPDALLQFGTEESARPGEDECRDAFGHDLAVVVSEMDLHALRPLRRHEFLSRSRCRQHLEPRRLREPLLAEVPGDRVRRLWKRLQKRAFGPGSDDATTPGNESLQSAKRLRVNAEALLGPFQPN